ncbi:uncharacterized protein NEMAJ01_0796 [Nematocida major]|uniref:uncharacterized protein n=1 Tax=Nematocida major TaxID=1912982 RepID=UPI0020086252|nr:uncharacterized protein NEMAJ01_0796 [Nematocida major]KAH9385900.1 hypothetical protein NEMAJ01_0796 [Nematocida major]
MTNVKAIRIGGKGSARRAPTKKQMDADKDKGFLTALSSNGYKCSEMKNVERCSFMTETDSVINYPEPELKAITKDNAVVGYIIKGKGELLGDDSNRNFDLDSIVKYLGTKGVDVEGLVERAKKGDNTAIEEILRLVRASAEAEDKDAKKPE